MSVSAVIFDFYSALASAAPLMHVDANKGCPSTPCHALPRQTTQAKPQGFLSPPFSSPSFVCLSCCSHLQNFSARISFCLFYMAVCVACPRVASSSTPAPVRALLLLLVLLHPGNRDAFTNSCKLNLLRRACAHLMTLLAKLATRYFPGQA